jgi:hypothetical protein
MVRPEEMDRGSFDHDRKLLELVLDIKRSSRPAEKSTNDDAVNLQPLAGRMMELSKCGLCRQSRTLLALHI